MWFVGLCKEQSEGMAYSLSTYCTFIYSCIRYMDTQVNRFLSFLEIDINKEGFPVGRQNIRHTTYDNYTDTMLRCILTIRMYCLVLSVWDDVDINIRWEALTRRRLGTISCARQHERWIVTSQSSDSSWVTRRVNAYEADNLVTIILEIYMRCTSIQPPADPSEPWRTQFNLVGVTT